MTICVVGCNRCHQSQRNQPSLMRGRPMTDTINAADMALKSSDDPSVREKNVMTDNPMTAESTNGARGNSIFPAAATKDDDDMSTDIEIGSVDDADEYSI